MGMDGHEWPYLVKNNMFGWNKALTAQPGMVFSDEPGIYIRGEFGVRLEDDMLHHRQTARSCSRRSRSVWKNRFETEAVLLRTEAVLKHRPT